MAEQNTIESVDDETSDRLVNGITKDITQNDQRTESQSFKQKLMTNKTFQKKFIVFLCLCYSFLILGLNIGQFGPTLLDLQIITGCTLDQASFFFNAHTLGYLTSSILTGFLFGRLNKLIQMFIPCFMLTFVNLAIPWCSVYEVMVTVHFTKGLFLGFIDAVANGLLLHLLAQDAKTYLQILHFMFAFGGIISPLISAPFLSMQNYTNHTIPSVLHNITRNSTEFLDLWNRLLINTSVTTNNTLGPTYGINSTEASREISSVYKAYTMTAVMSLSSAIPYLVLFFRTDDSKCPTSKTQTEDHPKENIPMRLKISVLVILSFIIATYTAIEDTYAGFLMTFTVKHLKWTKARGSFATSIYWTSFAVGRFTGIFIVNIFKQTKLLRVYSIMIVMAFICLLVTSLYYIDEGIWIASTIVGFAMSIFFPIFFSWTEEKFFHVDGKVTALIMTTAMIGVIVNPIILARVMEKVPIWFGYVLLTESGMLFLFYSVGVYVARKIKKFKMKDGKDGKRVMEVEVDPLVNDSKL